MSFFLYISQTTLIMAVFILVYMFLLERQTMYGLNRIFLWLSVSVALSAPLLSIQIANTTPVDLVHAAEIWIDEIAIQQTSTADQINSLSWRGVLLMLYFTVSSFLLLRLIIEIRKIIIIKRSSEIIQIEGLTCVTSGAIKAPFSFFNAIYLPAGHAYSENDIRKIIEHERKHVIGLHSIDVILMECLLAVFWINPVMYAYRRKLKEVHEFIADAEVLRHTPWEEYAAFLVSQRHHSLQQKLSSHLLYSQLKSRLVMMSKKPSSPASLWRYASFLPVAVIALLMFSFEEKPFSFSEKEGIVADTIPSSPYSSLRNTTPAVADNDHGNPHTYDLAMPVFPTCKSVPIADKAMCTQMELTHFIANHLKYPESLRRASVEGKVMIKFIIGIDGLVRNAAIEKSLHPDADKAVMELFGSMNDKLGRWEPARKEGMSKETELVLPVSFALDDKKVSKEKDNTIQTFAEEMPRFPGCEELESSERDACAQMKLYEFMFKNIQYPLAARQRKEEGVVMARFVVRENGKLDDIRILRGISTELDSEVIRLFNMMNEQVTWIPARHEGKTVAMEFTIPVRFKLDSQEKDIEEKEVTHAFPNPADNYLQVTLNGTASAIKVYDLEGKEVQSHVPGDGITDYKLNTSALPDGYYVVKVLYNDKTETMKFSVVH